MFMLSLLSSLASVESALAAPTSISLRWQKNLGPNALMTCAPVAADLYGNGKMEIIVTGGPATGTSGSVTALNPIDGSILWQDTSANISSIGIDQHCAPETADLLGNGQQEIIVPTWNGPLVLFPNGTLYWRRTDISGGNVYLSLADINGDGHPEIFVSRGLGPANGYDYTTVLSYNGSVLYQGWSWHDCWGGITVADPTGSGNFMIFQGDRSYFYADTFGPPPDAYTGGGMGVHAYDAFTLKEIWSDPTILCSSQIPILANVDNNGALEVIVAMQNLAPPIRNSSNSQGGIAVLNSADGSVDTTGGIYRKGWTNMNCHSQPTVYDFDGDGHLELMDCYDSQVKVWDLVTWQPDGYLPLNSQVNITCHEPPKVGQVTADGKMDIIAMNVNDSYMDVFQYDPSQPGKYGQVYKSTVQMPGANDFTLVEDLDNDGYNELVATSRAGYVYCFNRPAKAQSPQPRSGVQFYSELRNGVAVYVPPPTPIAPVLRAEQPQNGTVNQAFNPQLSITATSFQNRPMNITFGTNATGSWSQIGSTLMNKPNGVYSVSTTSMNVPGTNYFWSVSSSDGVTVTTNQYGFTTYSNPPTQGTPNLVSDASGNLTCYNQTTSDPNNDPVTNIYNWQVNGTSMDTLNLPFNTRTTSNLLIYDNIAADGFENGFGGWNGTGNWDLNTAQKHSGTYSAHAGAGDQYLTSSDMDTSSAQSVTVSFWYMDQGFGSSNSVSLQFWNGTAYNNIFAFTSSNPTNSWQWYSVQTFSPQYVIHNFRVRFGASGIGTGNFWLDDFAVTCPARTKDYSGNNNHGTVHGATWTPNGAVGGAYIFDGTDDYIRVNDNPSLGGDGTWSQISIEFWISPAVNQTGTKILAKRDPTMSDANSSYMIGFESSGTPNTLYWGVNNGSSALATWQEASSNASVLAVGNWYHVICTYSSGPGLTIYINGTQVVNIPVTGNISSSNYRYLFGAPLFIGFDGGNSLTSTWFNGMLDELHIYNRTLSPAQVLQCFLQTRNGQSSKSTVVSEETNVGENWTCQITPNDSFGDGQSKLSNVVIVGSPTQQLDLNINSAHDSPNPSTGDNFFNNGSSVTCSVTSPVTEGSNVYTCTGWTGTGSVPPSGLIASVTFTITQNSTITWNWILTPPVGLVVGVSGSGTTNATGTATYNAGTVVAVSATPAVGWTLNNWLLNGTNVGSANPYVLTMTQNYNLTAVFSLVPTTLFSGDFESGNFTGWSGTSTSSGESAVVTGSAAYQGSYGALFGSIGNGGSEYAYCYESIAGQSELFARGYFNVNQSGIGTTNNNRFYFLIFRAGGNSVAFAGWRVVGGVVEWELLIRDGTGWVSVYNSSNIVLGQWYSIELHWYENSTSGYAQMYVNGQLTCSSQGRNTANYGPVDTVRVGLPELYNCGPTTVYCDNVIINNTYIGPISSNPTNVTVYLQSVASNGSSSNYGSITFNGTTQSLPFNGTYTSGTYSAQYTPNSGYTFVNWTATGNVSVSNALSNPTTVTVNGNGNLTAFYTNSTVLLSGDFESGNFTGWSGTSTSSGESAVVTGSAAYQGSYGALFGSIGNGGSEYAYCYESIAGQSELFARGYFNVNQSGIGTTNNNRFYFLIFRAGGNSVAFAGWRVVGGVVEWELLIRDGTGWVSVYNSSNIVLGQWYSIELHWYENSTSGYAQMYVNGQLTCSSQGRNTANYGPVDTVRVGLPELYNCGPTTVYCDNVIISKTYNGP